MGMNPNDFNGRHQTTNLGGRSSNLFARATKLLLDQFLTFVLWNGLVCKSSLGPIVNFATESVTRLPTIRVCLRP